MKVMKHVSEGRQPILSGYIVEKYNNMTGAYTCHRLAEEARERNIKIDIVGVHDCCLSETSEESSQSGREIVINSQIELTPRDFVINRYKWGKIKDALNSLAKKSYNRIEVYDIYKNKYEQLKRLKSEHFMIPRHMLATNRLPFQMISYRVGLPFVMKALENSMGRDVMLIENEEQYLLTRERYPADQEWLYEEYISSSYGRDLRLFAIRGEAVACMMRKSKGDFRANVALGASVDPYPISPKLRQIAKDICQQTGLDFVGIDLLFASENEEKSEENYALCEINVMPGLEGIESASGVNIAGKIIDMIIEDFYPPF